MAEEDNSVMFGDNVSHVRGLCPAVTLFTNNI